MFTLVQTIEFLHETNSTGKDWNKTETQKILEMKMMFKSSIGKNKGKRNANIISSTIKVLLLSNFHV
jgi:hypothetical protein